MTTQINADHSHPSNSSRGGKILQFRPQGQRQTLRMAKQQGIPVLLILNSSDGDTRITGYVVEIGREWVLLETMSNQLSPDGCYAVRIRDITEVVQPHPHCHVIDKAFASAVRQVSRHNITPDELDDINSVLHLAQQQAPVVGIYTSNEEASNTFYVGQVLSSNEQAGLVLQEITPDAEWLDDPSTFELSEIIAVSWDDPYFQILFKIATGTQ